MSKKKTVFLTGASGNMGFEGFKELLARRDKFNIVALVLPSKNDKKKMSAYENMPGVKIVWGDLTNYNDVLHCVTGADFVFHAGGMVSPAADYFPELTTKVNIGAAQNIVNAIKAQPNADEIKLVYIGTVAQTGDRNPPLHWGRTGDPIFISKFDNYAYTKTVAEQIVIESGLKYWASLRQTGILYPTMNKKLDPIMFHVPVNGVFEWATVTDSGRLIAHACEDEMPEDFWRRIYNIGGGEKFRTNNYEFLDKTSKATGVKDFREIFELNWYATQNFHGQWYEDSDVLESYLHFRSSSVEQYLDELANKPSASKWMTKLLPASFIKNKVMKPIAYKEKYGTMWWMENNIQDKIEAYFGSKEAWRNIPSWQDYQHTQPSAKPVRLQHGYDEQKPKSSLGLADMQQAATYRGGACTSPEMKDGDIHTKLQWTCAFNHSFEASPALVLLGGHWCPHCMKEARYEEEAKRNPFFGQVWSR